MNKNQIILMWIGIAVFVCFALTTKTISQPGPYKDSLYITDYGPLVTRLVSTVLVTVALIYTLKNKKSKAKDQKLLH